MPHRTSGETSLGEARGEAETPSDRNILEVILDASASRYVYQQIFLRFYTCIILFGFDRLYNVCTRNGLRRVLTPCYIATIYSTGCIGGVAYFCPTTTNHTTIAVEWIAMIINIESFVNAMLIGICVHLCLDPNGDSRLPDTISELIRENCAMVLASPLSSILWSTFSMIAFALSFPATADAEVPGLLPVPNDHIEVRGHNPPLQPALGNAPISISLQWPSRSSAILIGCLAVAAIIRLVFTICTLNSLAGLMGAYSSNEHSMDILPHHSRLPRDGVGGSTRTEDAASQITQDDQGHSDFTVHYHTSHNTNGSQISLDLEIGSGADTKCSGTSDGGIGESTDEQDMVEASYHEQGGTQDATS